MGNCHSFCGSLFTDAFLSRYLPFLRRPEQLSGDVREQLEHVREQLNQATTEQLGNAREQLEQAREGLNQAAREQTDRAKEQFGHVVDGLNRAKEEQLSFAKDQLNKVQGQIDDSGQTFKDALASGVEKITSSSITSDLPIDLNPLKDGLPGSVISEQTDNAESIFIHAIDQSSAAITKNLTQLNPKNVFRGSFAPHGI